MQRPLETAPIFYNNRPRLEHIAPLSELLKLIQRYKNDCNRYPIIRECTKVTIDRISTLFSNDILDLFNLGYELGERVYKITGKGRIQLENRLNTVYSDGKDFSFASSKLKVNIPPLIDLKPKITKTEEEAVVVMSTSKEIGKDIGVEVRYATEFLSSYQLSSFPSSVV